MGTKNFNFLDKIIAFLRLKHAKNYLKKNGIILDFGCGHQAYFLRSVKKLINIGIGIDYEVETQTIPPNIKLINFKYKDKLPFPNNYFTQIYMLATLEHIEPNKIPKLFREFKRTLKRNGEIILTTPTPKSKPLLEFLAFNLKIISSDEIADHKKYYSKKDIVKIAEQSKLKLFKYQTFELGLNSLAILKKP